MFVYTRELRTLRARHGMMAVTISVTVKTQELVYTGVITGKYILYDSCDKSVILKTQELVYTGAVIDKQ